MSAFDYGAIVIKNGKVITEEEYGKLGMEYFVGWEDNEVQPNYFAYIGDEKLTLCFYKFQITVFVDKIEQHELFLYEYANYTTNKKSFVIQPSGQKIKVKMISDDVYHITTRIGEDNYQVIFGYGIPYNRKEWEDIKKYKTYLTYRERKRIDNILRKYW